MSFNVKQTFQKKKNVAHFTGYRKEFVEMRIKNIPAEELAERDLNKKSCASWEHLRILLNFIQ